jgi:hypothetical protein
MTVPWLPEGNYRVKYEINREIIAEQAGELREKRIVLKPVHYIPPAQPEFQAVKEVPDNVLEKAGIQ